MKLYCKRCKKDWEYSGNIVPIKEYSQYTTCPRCKSSIKINVEEKKQIEEELVKEELDQEELDQEEIVEEVKEIGQEEDQEEIEDQQDKKNQDNEINVSFDAIKNLTVGAVKKLTWEKLNKEDLK